MPRALVTGVTGQDGSFIAEQLLAKGYDVIGVARRSSSDAPNRIVKARTHRHFQLVEGDVIDAESMRRVVADAKPDEVYHLAAQSHVGTSYEQPTLTVLVISVGTQNVLEAVRREAPKARLYHASSSEIFGKVKEVPQRETTHLHPRSPYACAKAHAHYLVQCYREAYGLFAVNGVCFNHTSHRRGGNFVEAKIARGVARMKVGLQTELRLGNLDAARDFGWAPEYTDAMWRTLQQDEPRDYVIATGEAHTIRELVELAYDAAELPRGQGLISDSSLRRPAEVDQLLGDPTRATEILGWKAEVLFAEIVQRLVKHEISELAPRLF